MTKKLKMGYTALCVVCILNFIYDNYKIIAISHIGQILAGTLLGKTYHFLLGLSSPLYILSALLPLIISIIVSVIVFKFYRNSLTKATANLAIFGFVPYLLFSVLCFFDGGLITIVVGIIKVIYSIIMIICMVRDIKRLSA